MASREIPFRNRIRFGLQQSVSASTAMELEADEIAREKAKQKKQKNKKEKN